MDTAWFIVGKAVMWTFEHWPMPGLPLIVLLGLVCIGWGLTRQSWLRTWIVRRGVGRRKMLTYFLFMAGGAAIMYGAVFYAGHLEAERAKREESKANLVRNPKFENGTEHWGTGYLEDLVRNGNHREEVERLPYVVGTPHPCKVQPPRPPRCDTKVTETDSTGQHDSHVVRPGGSGSFRFNYRGVIGDHRYGTLAQRIHGLTKNRPHILTYYAKASKGTNSGAFFATTDLRWANSPAIELTEEWTRYHLPFTSGDFDYAEIRFVIQKPGTVWITDVDVREVKNP